MDWSFVGQLLGFGLSILNDQRQQNYINDQRDAADRARAAADASGKAAAIGAAGANAASIRANAELQGLLLEQAGDFAAMVGEYNADIFEKQAEIAVKLATREIKIIGDNGDVAATMMDRQFQRVQSSAVAAIGSSGITLSGSAIDVLLSNAAEADYMRARIEWTTDVAQENRKISGDLQQYTSLVNADRERFLGELTRTVRYREAALTRHFADEIASAEEAAAQEM